MVLIKIAPPLIDAGHSIQGNWEYQSEYVNRDHVSYGKDRDDDDDHTTIAIQRYQYVIVRYH